MTSAMLWATERLERPCSLPLVNITPGGTPGDLNLADHWTKLDTSHLYAVNKCERNLLQNLYCPQAASHAAHKPD